MKETRNPIQLTAFLLQPQHDLQEVFSFAYAAAFLLSFHLDYIFEDALESAQEHAHAALDDWILCRSIHATAGKKSDTLGLPNSSMIPATTSLNSFPTALLIFSSTPSNVALHSVPVTVVLIDSGLGDDHRQRQVKFPKGKKAKRVDADGIQDGNGEKKRWMDPSLAAKERSKRRNKMRESEVLGDQVDGLSGEVQYEDNTNFEDDGIQIEPFNLKQEREEGYFDANGNFVEYAKQNEIKDAWLDSVVVDTKLAGKFKPKASAEEAYDDLSSDDVGKIKRRIANALQPGETIIQALKRLKGPSTDKKAKMLETSKWIFDQLTEDAMKLMENGEYS
ncbi:hypothetical protein ZIOFF_042331 [Zingiber officinale]|uniref:CD2 antigen cytoplasmic tail-binding protein 2 n=1 Tax=Zingiber officinale TaxID=94328 RepID=A0A8J5FUJ8_ZINOF|nr:hypothetical protein ZIOFF_042331 [Zingiber officinale]